MMSEILQRDNRWAIFYGDVSLEVFITKLPEIRFYKEVNKDVQDAFSIIQKLLVHSYYEYLFIDVAVSKALQTFEMALKIRYKEITTKDWSKPGRNLEQLIEWFRTKDYLEYDSKDFLDHVRKVRNNLSHPERHTVAGSTWFHWINTCVNLINDLYDDTALRKERKTLSIEVNQKLKTFLQHGARLKYKSESLIYNHGHVRVNNLVDPYHIQFSLLEVFDNSAEVKRPLVISCDFSALDLESTILTLVDPDGVQLILTNELSDRERELIEVFRNEIKEDPDKMMQHNSLLFDSQDVMLKTWREERHLGRR